MSVKLITINPQDSGVPIPNSLFTISKNLFDFDALDGSIGYFGLQTTGILSINYEDNILIHPIGLKVKMVNDSYSVNNTVTFQILGRCQFSHIDIGDDGLTLFAEVEDLAEELLPDEYEVAADIDKIVSITASQETALAQAITKAINESNTSDCIVHLDIIAKHVLRSMSEQLSYIQALSHIERLFIVTSAWSNIFPPKTRKKGKSPTKPGSIKDQIRALKLDPDIYASVYKELERLDRIPSSSSEYSHLLDYLNWITDLPWSTYSTKEYDLKQVIPTMNESHYGLDDIKETLLEYLTIETITNKPAGSILCLVGPPGTGKTSIAKQLAKVAGRKIVPIALGGMSDESELRGHRRTYLASRPGRIIVGLKNVKTADPLFLLDEIDKITSFRGDPSAALLEILDREQNHNFIDRYLEVPFDLSKAMFICTANNEKDIPEPLRDRMEIIHFRTYSYEERKQILIKHLIPKVIADYSLQDYQIEISEQFISYLANTQNIRQIENILRKHLRKAAVDIKVYDKEQVLIDILDTSFSKTKKPIGFANDR